MAAWTYDPVNKVYRDGNGDVLTLAQLIVIRDGLADGFEVIAAAIVLRYTNDEITLEEFAVLFTEFLWTANVTQFLLGRGGVNAVLPGELLAVEQMVITQTIYLSKFIREMSSGSISANQAAARATLYAGSAVHSFDIGRQTAFDGLQLPYYPADGLTICMSRCRCWWSISESATQYEAFWHTQEDKDVCETCLHRENESNPYVQHKTHPGGPDWKERMIQDQLGLYPDATVRPHRSRRAA